MGGDAVVEVEIEAASNRLTSRLWFQLLVLCLASFCVMTMIVCGTSYYILRKEYQVARREFEKITNHEKKESFFWKPALKLLCSVVIDILGSVLSFIPVVGAIAEFAWAPLSALLIFLMYRDVTLSSVGFFEEALPVPFLGTLPTASLSWFKVYWRIPFFWSYSLLAFLLTKLGFALRPKDS